MSRTNILSFEHNSLNSSLFDVNVFEFVFQGAKVATFVELKQGNHVPGIPEAAKVNICEILCLL